MLGLKKGKKPASCRFFMVVERKGEKETASIAWPVSEGQQTYKANGIPMWMMLWNKESQTHDRHLKCALGVPYLDSSFHILHCSFIDWKCSLYCLFFQLPMMLLLNDCPVSFSFECANYKYNVILSNNLLYGVVFKMKIKTRLTLHTKKMHLRLQTNIKGILKQMNTWSIRVA